MVDGDSVAVVDGQGVENGFPAPLIEMQGVEKVYKTGKREFPALRDLDLVMGKWAEPDNVEFGYELTNASRLNRIGAHFQAMRGSPLRRRLQITRRAEIHNPSLQHLTAPQRAQEPRRELCSSPQA